MQDGSLARREFLGRFLGGNRSGNRALKGEIPPPYFGGTFACEECLAPCVKSCTRELLHFDGVRVIFSFKNLGCNFCKECAKACESLGKEVLSLKNPPNIQAKVTINPKGCLAWNKTVCYSCQEACRFKAIDFLGIFNPVINEQCTGCAECLEACFVNSIIMEGI